MFPGSEHMLVIYMPTFWMILSDFYIYIKLFLSVIANIAIVVQ